MKNHALRSSSRTAIVGLIAMSLIPRLCLGQSPENMLPDATRAARMAWWHDARFGLFIHWGLYSIPAGVWEGRSSEQNYAEWSMHNLKIPLEEYRQLAKEFNPVKFNADEWAKLAADAGMGYFVLTTKHHDGFAMFDSDVSDYNVVDATPFKRDVFGELATAFRKQGLRVGAYYSQDIDWSRPQGNNESYNTWDFHVPAGDTGPFDQYMQEKSLPQVKELCTRYGELSVIWFDVPRTVEQSRGKLFHDMVRAHQPDAVINGRIANPQGVYADYLVPGDNGYYTSPQDFNWECCATMNESWGYTKLNREPKSADELIVVLLKSASSGGNFLLNIGPKPDGTIPEDQVQILKEMAAWMKDNRESIHGSRANPFGEFFDWGLCTRKGTDLYLHVTEWKDGKTIMVPRLKNDVAAIRLLGDAGRKLKWKKAGNNVAITLSGDPLHTSASVIKVGCAGDALAIEPVQLTETDGVVDLSVRYGFSTGQRMRRLRHYIQNSTAVVNMSEGHPTETLSWTFQVKEPGTFRVKGDCLDPDVKRIKRTVILTQESGDETSFTLSADKVSGQTIEFGTIRIEQPGEVRLSMKVKGGQETPLYLKGLRLIRE